MSELSVGSLSGLAANSYVIDVASGSQLTQPGMILQVVSAAKTDTFSTASTSPEDVTGLSVTITPSSATSKVLVLVNAFFGTANFGGSTAINGRLVRDSTTIAGGGGDYFFQTSILEEGDAEQPHCHSLSFLDSPATTSATTYKVQLAAGSASTAYINRTRDVSASSTSTITVMEIAG